jgi:hypothetical protein
LFYHGKSSLPLRAAQGRKQETTDDAVTFCGGGAHAITTASDRWAILSAENHTTDGGGLPGLFFATRP